MNVYMVKSDGENEVYLAESFKEACTEALRVINEENPPEEPNAGAVFFDEADIEQVVLVGEIKNWPLRIKAGNGQ